FLTDQGGGWGGIFSVPYIGNTIEWYVDNLIAPGSTQKYKIFDNLAAAAPVGANGLKIDLKKPPRMIKASPGDVARAVMENAALQLQEKLTELKDHGIEFDRAVIVGGPSRSPIWPRIISDATGLKLIIGDSYAGAKGAAMLAGIGIGIYSDEEDAWNKAGVKHEY
ncbi:MAG: FGGY-family carbohydrate kinase, partial [Smithellaceae bacterium]|nr:FGGY-family carbohydrate kinase [Smithellaceae bacterium]